MDQFISMLRQKCIAENILGEVHMLLHADDTVVSSTTGELHMLLHADGTVVFSTTYELFINKCNTLISLYKENRLELNFKKSGLSYEYQTDFGSVNI